jgi:metal-dependent amidase/aminoacylase/carboxypeptidase family protein
MVNAIPEQVRIESYVRGATFEAIAKANRRINQALCGAALSIDTNVEIIDMPGYSPLVNAPDMMEVYREAVETVLPDVPLYYRPLTYSAGSTDMGDLSCVMPVVHPYAGGSRGHSHGSDYEIFDPESACVKSAMVQVAMLRLLLGDGAKRAKQIKADFKPLFASKEEYLAFQDSLNTEGDRIVYGEDRSATVTW